MNVFELRQDLLASYAAYIRSFIQIRDPVIRTTVEQELDSGLLWPETLIQLNPSFEPGRTTDELADNTGARSSKARPGTRQRHSTRRGREQLTPLESRA
jgi:hypothetical protein